MPARFSPETDRYDDDCLNCWVRLAGECSLPIGPFMLKDRTAPLPCKGEDLIALTAGEVIQMRRAMRRGDTKTVNAIRVAAEARA